MAQITLITKDGLLKKEYEEIEFNGSVLDFCVERYFESKVPFIVYDGEPSKDKDITLDIDKMANGYGHYTIIETPAGLEPLAITSIVLIVLSVAVVLLAPKPKMPNNVNRSQESPNNSLSSKSNVARPLQRIPDIFGRVKSIPDIIMPTYRTYAGTIVYDNMYLCIGSGQLKISNLQDGDTPIDLIGTARAAVYYPSNNPNNGTPEETFGDYIQENLYSPYRINEVNGVDLPIDNGLVNIDLVASGATVFINSKKGADKVRGIKISSTYDTQEFYVGNTLVLTNADYDYLGVSYTMASYELRQVFRYQNNVYLFMYDANNFNNLVLEPFLDGTLETEQGQVFNNWYYNTSNTFDYALINVAAVNGIYRDDGGASLLATTVDYTIEVQGIVYDGADWIDDGNSSIIANAQITGGSQSLQGVSTWVDLITPKAFKVRVKRTSPFSVASGTVVDSIKLQDVYGMKNLESGIDFGNITTLHVISVANASATSGKENQINCIATEMILEYLGGGVFDTVYTENIDANGNSSAVQSFIAASMNEYIGGLAITDIDADNMLNLEGDIIAYFGDSNSAQFNYTFDSTEITYQEITQTMFNAINCIAYRDSNKIKAVFEKTQNLPSMLFTHRSKRPNSETYTRNFNKSIENDGIQFNWVNPETNTNDTITYSVDGTGITFNPKNFDIAGIRNETQATIRARRELNKIKYKKVNCDVVVTAEGRFVRPSDMVAIVKGSRVLTQDGEVLDQTGLTLTLSSDVTFVDGDTNSITLKLDNGSTENIICSVGSETNEVVLLSTPTQTIRTGTDSRRTEFSFGNDSRHDSENWLIQEIDLADKWFVKLKGINYDSRYYHQDTESLNAFSDGFSDGFS